MSCVRTVLGVSIGLFFLVCPLHAGFVYMQDWETGTGGWTAQTGSVERVEVPGAPSGTWVQQISHNNVEHYYYYSPFIPVVSGQTYQISAWIDWVSGGCPFLGVYVYDPGYQKLSSNWLIGAPCSDPPGIVTIVPMEDGWHQYSALFTMPAGAGYIKLVDKVWGYGRKDYAKPGDDLSYFDDHRVALVPLPGAIFVGGLGVICGQIARRRLAR
ncbi:MAG: carbohydrate binding domain-containing protein [Sedimentisphaerales bacterium]|nr:carbohydrate binding domain-containing protein [Sedimentisphaerales bacterium]